MQKLTQLLYNRKLNALVSLTIVVVVVFGVFSFVQNKNDSSQRIADDAQAKLYLTPASGTQFANNSQVSVNVMLDARSQNVTGTRVELQYDNSKLTSPVIDKSGSAFGEDNLTVNPSFAENKVVIVASKPEDNPVTGNGKKIATINFTSKATGNAKLEFVGNNIVEIVANGVSTNVSIEKPSVEYTIGTTTSPGVTSTASPVVTSSLSITPGQGANRCIPTGDIDGNGTVNTVDLNLLESALENSDALTPVQMERGNMSGSTSYKGPTQRDYDYLKLLIEGRGSEVFPGNPPVCPYLHNVFVTFSNRNVTLNVNNLNPTRNKIVIYNPEKKKISSVSIILSLPSSLARITNITPLNGLTFTTKATNGFSIYNIPTANPQEVLEIAELEIVPWTLGYTINQGELKIANLTIYDDQNQNAGLRYTDRYGIANYTVIRNNTTVTTAPTSQVTQQTTQAVTVTPINASPPVGGASVRISATIPGVGTAFASDNKNPTEPNRQVQIQLTKSGDTTPINATGTLTFNGSAYVGYVIIPNIAPGNYQIKARLNNTLYKTISGIYNLQDTSSVNTTTVALNSGDINQDNRIDLYDYNIILGCVQQKASCTPSLRALSDLDSSGSTNAADYNIFLTQLRFREGD